MSNLIYRDINTSSFKIIIHEVNHSNSVWFFFYISTYNCVYIKHIATIIYTSIFTQCYLYVKYFLCLNILIMTTLMAT